MTDHTLQKQMIQTGAAFCGLSVAFGAIGAHLLKDKIDEHAIDTFQIAIRYQFYHAFTILVIGAMLRKFSPKYAKLTYQLFLYGIIIFCGSLYILSLRSLLFNGNGDGLLFIGGLTPLGGVLFISGWAILTFKGYKASDGPRESSHNYRRHSSSNEKNENHGIN